MHGALKTQPNHQLPTVSENEGTNYFTQILLKKEKTLDDAHIIYEKIKGFSSFHDFFAGNLNKLDMSKILNVCQCFKYEKYNRGDFVFKQGDRSNDKFYIILSGEVAVMNNQRLGDFGSTQPHATISRSPQSVTFLTAKDYSTAKQSSISSVSEFPRKHPVFKNLKEIDTQKKVLQRLDNVRDSSEPAPSKSKIASKMKKVYDAVKAVRTMQRCLPGFKKAGSLLSEPENKEPVGTLQYLDEVEDKEEEDRKEFEAMASSYGTIMQYSTVGESFGELAAKKNAARNKGILCRTDVEFLVLEKQQYDEVFGKLEKEREEFLKSVFPILKSISSANYNFLVCCFKTERYSKGSYIINEGPKDSNKKAKFYIIQSGECVLEKKMPKKTKNTVNMKQKLASLYDNVQITVAGKGSIIGEEILDSQDQYEYSVKVLSETVIVQAITKKDFRYRFPQDFQEYVTSLYETKQKHRETMLNALRKDIPSEKPESKSTNTSSVANTSISHLATQSARQTFSRYLQRESKVDPAAILKTTISPRTNQPTSHRESSLPSFRGMYNLESSKEVLAQTFRGPSLDKEKGPSKSDKPIRGDPVSLKIDFLNRISSPSKQNVQNEEGAFESGGFFSEFQNDKDRKTIKIRLAHKTKQNNKGEKKVLEEQPKGVRDSVDLIMNKFFSRKEDLEMVQKAIMNQVEQQDIVVENTTKPPLVLTKSLAQSRRGSMKSGTISDLNSLYNQKLLKGRPSIRQLSPSGLKTVESKSKPQSLNEIPSKEFLSTKPDTNSIRRTGGNASWSLNSLKLHPETEKALDRKKAKSRCELDEELGIPSIKQLDTEDDKEYVSSRLLEKEKEILKEKALINLVNMMDTNKKKKSPQASFSGMSKGMSSKGENPNPMYTHLNEAKEWRMKVFRKPQRLQTVINSARTSCENIRVAPEGKKPFEVCEDRNV